EPYELEFRARRQDGALRWHRARVEPVLLASGEVERWVGTATDSHLTHEAAAAEPTPPAGRDEEASQAQLDALFEGATVGLALFDCDLRYQRINRWLAELNGLSAADHVGKRPDEISPLYAASMSILAE